MDIRGAALATVIANMIVIPICFILMIKKKEEYAKFRMEGSSISS